MGWLYSESGIGTGGVGRAVANVLDIALLSLTETGPVAGTMGEAAL